jgi:hypothetical protein
MKSKELILNKITNAKRKVDVIQKQIEKIRNNAKDKDAFPSVCFNLSKQKTVLMGSIVALEWVLEETNS